MRPGETSFTPLTDLVSCGGCAAKYSAALLQDLIGTFPEIDDSDLLVGLAPSDDAAVYRLDDERALVFTTDFFPPIVDDAADFGAIAAANALNDVYAMGGSPLLALSVAAFPEQLPGDDVRRLLESAARKVREAGAVLAGGHTLRQDEPLYGLAVVGTVAPDRIWTKAGARPGDLLYLTKPLGTGLLVHGRKERRTSSDVLAGAVEQMQTLNAEAAGVLCPFSPHAVTDVTGFGLIGHAHEMADRSGVAIVLDADALPILAGAAELAEAGVRTGGDPRNRAYVGNALTVDGASESQAALAFDPQTAGGLLAAVPPDRAAALEESAAGQGVLLARIGLVRAGRGITLAAAGRA